MNTKLLKTIISLFFVLLWVSCEDPNDEQANNQNNNDDPQESSTIGQDLTGSQDPIASVFFDLTDDFPVFITQIPPVPYVFFISPGLIHN